jgi:hypothetical protein
MCQKRTNINDASVFSVLRIIYIPGCVVIMHIYKLYLYIALIHEIFPSSIRPFFISWITDKFHSSMSLVLVLNLMKNFDAKKGLKNHEHYYILGAAC